MTEDMRTYEVPAIADDTLLAVARRAKERIEAYHQRQRPQDVEAGEHELELVAVAAETVDRDLEPLRGRGAGDTADLDPVGALLAQPDRVEVRGHVGVEVAGRLDLVEQLRGDGVDGDRAAGAVVLGDHAAEIGRAHV